MTSSPFDCTLRELAAGLHVHRNTAARWAREGMPRTSVEAAQEWHRRRHELQPAVWHETRGCWSYFRPLGWAALRSKSSVCRCLTDEAIPCTTPREKKHGTRLVRVRWATKNLVVCCARCGAVVKRLKPERVPKVDLERVTRL